MTFSLVCERCNGAHMTNLCPIATPKVSEAEHRLDSLVEAGSVPSLANLFAQARNRGLVTAGWQYGDTSN